MPKDKFSFLINTLGCRRASDLPVVEKFSTGIGELDRILSGGLPRGHMSEWFGRPASHKTTMLLKIVANNQKVDKDFVAVLYDAEGRFSSEWAKDNGVDIDRLLVIPQDYHADDIFDKYIYPIIANDSADLIIIDSIAALNFKKLATRDVSKATQREITMNTRLERSTRLTDICNDLSGGVTWKDQFLKLGNSRVHLAFVNHQKINTNGRLYTPGGFSVEFRSSIRVEFRVTSREFVDSEILSQTVHISIEKNSVGLPFGETDLKYYWENHSYFPLLDYSIIEKAIDQGLVTRNPKGYFKSEFFKGTCKESGFFKKLRNSPELVAKLGIDYHQYFGEDLESPNILNADGELL